MVMLGFDCATFFSFDANINKIIYLRYKQYFVLKLLFKRTDDNDKFIFDFFLNSEDALSFENG